MLQGKNPLFASAFGDVFLEDDTAIWFLDTLDGTLSSIWPNRAMLTAELQTGEGQDRFLLGGLAQLANESGLVLGDGQIYDFSVDPILGGKFSIDNMRVSDFVVTVNLRGQILQKVKQLPAGTKVRGFTVDGQAPKA